MRRCWVGTFLVSVFLSACAINSDKLATQMELDQATCARDAPVVVKLDKNFCLTHLTQAREEHEKSLPTVLGNVIGGVLTTAGTLFVGAI